MTAEQLRPPGGPTPSCSRTFRPRDVPHASSMARTARSTGSRSTSKSLLQFDVGRQAARLGVNKRSHRAPQATQQARTRVEERYRALIESRKDPVRAKALAPAGGGEFERMLQED